jgi:hypothetical protein
MHYIIAKFVVFGTRTATHWAKHFGDIGKCPLTNKH